MPTFHDLDQGSYEWKQFRFKTIGASEIATVLGLNPYETREGLWSKKTGRQVQKTNKFMRRGTSLEPHVRSLYEMSFNCDLSGTQHVCSHQDHPKISASLDGFLVDKNKVVELKAPSKTPAGETMLEASVDGQVPWYYWLQLQQQMFVMGAQSADFVVFDGQFIRWPVEVKPSVDVWEYIIKSVDVFMMYVEDDVFSHEWDDSFFREVSLGVVDLLTKEPSCYLMLDKLPISLQDDLRYP